jgi:hypothetical protein
MATNTATARTVFVLGTEVAGNREVLIVESGDTYDLDPATISTYEAATAEFPYGTNIE